MMTIDYIPWYVIDAEFMIHDFRTVFSSVSRLRVVFSVWKGAKKKKEDEE